MSKAGHRSLVVVVVVLFVFVLSREAQVLPDRIVGVGVGHRITGAQQTPLFLHPFMDSFRDFRVQQGRTTGFHHRRIGPVQVTVSFAQKCHRDLGKEFFLVDHGVCQVKVCGGGILGGKQRVPLVSDRDRRRRRFSGPVPAQHLLVPARGVRHFVQDFHGLVVQAILQAALMNEVAKLVEQQTAPIPVQPHPGIVHAGIYFDAPGLSGGVVGHLHQPGGVVVGHHLSQNGRVHLRSIGVAVPVQPEVGSPDQRVYRIRQDRQGPG
mmetsp:Transcript_6034/g.17165  ORF Transcript_6034/g.17165 Transcript_6034/m.17165 type:complete len:265 (+) Transcript_6034:2584-3378(+)